MLSYGTYAPSHMCPDCRMDSGVVTCVVCKKEISDKAIAQTWLRVVLPGGEWVAAYRLTPQDGRYVVGEVRLFPNEPKGAHPGQWSAERLGNDAPVPPGGLPARLIRAVKVTDHLAYVAKITQKDQGARYGAAAQLAKQGFSDPSASGKRGYSDLFYARVAAQYVVLLDSGASKPIRMLRKELADQGRHLSEASVRDLVRRARDRGLLTKTHRGRAGGQLTQKAIALLRQTDKETGDQPKVAMRNPGDGSVGEATEEAFEKVWKAKGWTRVQHGTEREQA